MRFSTLLLPALSLAATIHAAPVEEESNIAARASTSNPYFTVTNFSNSGQPHSVTSFVYFKVKSEPFGQTAECTAQKNGPIATAGYWTKCKPSSFGFGFTYDKTSKAYVLTITQNTGGNLLTGAVTVPNKQKTIVNKINPNGNVQSLVHEKNFRVWANLQ
ncbi:hypothetical protein TWF694_006284 [Orbilia ellipsospora]|uniref:AA1-like domain-containing protein n=1 Tax=Orbilia ellipsospora TaxID=2528407 RepID=A0AAV9XKK5_9PEZI